LRSALQALGQPTGGEVSARLAPKLGMQAAPTTFLRDVRVICWPSTAQARVVGLDDWASKRGDTYGTILGDLERHRVIDLLPDRKAETSWGLEQHPESEVISRDRTGYYADAARQGAPQAFQVAERFHVIKHMREKVQELLDRRRSCLPFVQEEIASAEREEDWQEKNASQQDQQRTQNRDKRSALYEEVKD
jgi:transposase